MEMIVIPRLSHSNNRQHKKRRLSIRRLGSQKAAGALALYRRIQISIHLIHSHIIYIYYIYIYINVYNIRFSQGVSLWHLWSVCYVTYVMLKQHLSPLSIYMLMGEPRGCWGVKKYIYIYIGNQVRHMSILSLLRDFRYM